MEKSAWKLFFECLRGVASANIVTTDFNPLNMHKAIKRTVGSAHLKA